MKFISTTDYTDDTDQKMIHEELSREIIGAAQEWKRVLRRQQAEEGVPPDLHS